GAAETSGVISSCHAAPCARVHGVGSRRAAVRPRRTFVRTGRLRASTGGLKHSRQAALATSSPTYAMSCPTTGRWPWLKPPARRRQASTAQSDLVEHRDALEVVVERDVDVATATCCGCPIRVPRVRRRSGHARPDVGGRASEAIPTLASLAAEP